MIVGNYVIHQVKPKDLQVRPVIVWLPPSYNEALDRRYPVLYMHDGQQIFDPDTSTWGQDWEVDEWCDQLIRAGDLQEIIVVGIYSTTERYEEYGASARAGAYTRFVIDELKSMIDTTYRTLPDRAHTAVAGSSMGGGLSFYMAWTRPDIFFGAACLSSAFSYKQGEIIFDLVNHATAWPNLRFYLHCGDGDELEQLLMKDLERMEESLAAKGWLDQPAVCVERAPGEKHNEAAWARYTGTWLKFLFGSDRRNE